MRHLRSLPAALLALGLLAGCGGKPNAGDAAAKPPALAAIVVRAEDAPRQQLWDGVVEAVQQVTITAQTNARVRELPYDVNDVVAKGDVLVRFSDVEQQSARQAARAQLASAEASYKEAQASFGRIEAVYAKGYVSAAQMDQQRAPSWRTSASSWTTPCCARRSPASSRVVSCTWVRRCRPGRRRRSR